MEFTRDNELAYAKWIKAFQRKNPDTISFSNSVKAINRAGGVRIKSLNPLEVETDTISEADFKQLGLLDDFYTFACKQVNKKYGSSLVISVDATNYTLLADELNGESVILVVDTNDDTKETPDIIYN